MFDNKSSFLGPYEVSNNNAYDLDDYIINNDPSWHL